MAESNRDLGIIHGRQPQQRPVAWWSARLTVMDDTTRTILHEWLVDVANEWYYQLERGEETNALHYQV